MPSYLVKEYFKEEDIKNHISNYSNDINKLAYAKKLDNLIKFKIDDELLPILKNNYKINYNEYDNIIGYDNPTTDGQDIVVGGSDD